MENSARVAQYEIIEMHSNAEKKAQSEIKRTIIHSLLPTWLHRLDLIARHCCALRALAPIFSSNFNVDQDDVIETNLVEREGKLNQIK